MFWDINFKEDFLFMSILIRSPFIDSEDKNTNLEKIFEFSPSEIFVTDALGNCVWANNTWHRNNKVPVNELIGRNVKDLVKEGYFYPSSTLEVLESKKMVSMIQSSNDGRKLYVESLPFLNEKNEILWVISNTMDITEIFSLKEKLRERDELIEIYNQQIKDLRKKIEDSNIVTKSPKMNKILELLNRLSAVDTTILLLGESGVGKTELAKWIHSQSSRKEADFIEINCGAIPSSLFESEFFGYEKGAFSGANQLGKKGYIELAENGTIFLDEIGELSFELQTKLLQVLQSKTYMKVGGTKVYQSNVRIIAATNRDLVNMVKDGTFRKDLYYRLAVIPVEIPPLRERKEDLQDLMFHILDTLNKQYGTKKVLSPQLVEEFIKYEWYGNIRELKNTMERLILTSDSEVIYPHAIIGRERDDLENKYVNAPKFDDMLLNEDLGLNEKLDLVEKEILSIYIEKYKDTRTIAKKLKSSQSTISRRCRKYGLHLNQ